MKKVGALLSMLSLLSLVVTTGALAAENLPWKLVKGSTFIGSDVENPKGEDLGDIKDVVIDRATGRIAYAVVSFGGFMGLGDKLYAVPWGAFSQAATDKDTFILDIDKERIKNSPGFDQNNWPQMVSREWVSGLYTYYNVPPYWTATTASPMTSATIKNVDPKSKTITLQVNEQMLQNLQAGDSAQVMFRKHPAAQH
jgi:sporulation protein YlmC with PRC-barrel domain